MAWLPHSQQDPKFVIIVAESIKFLMIVLKCHYCSIPMEYSEYCMLKLYKYNMQIKLTWRRRSQVVPRSFRGRSSLVPIGSGSTQQNSAFWPLPSWDWRMMDSDGWWTRNDKGCIIACFISEIDLSEELVAVVARIVSQTSEKTAS